MARLTIDENSDIKALASYWGEGGRESVIEPVLASLKYNVMAGIEKPSRINVVALLPPFARERLYGHVVNPTTAPDAVKQDCFWTAFNFFSEEPDNRINDFQYTAQVLQRDYVRVDAPSELGDLVLVVEPGGKAIHAANYIADDIVFTKNGLSPTQPWILGSLKDLVDTYRLKSQSAVELIYFRKRR
ncbi:MAG: hypothetical protein QM770_04475 [Tepidisphaeraceae bacterium]